MSDDAQPPISAHVIWLHGEGEKGSHWHGRFREGVSRLRQTWIHFDFPDAPGGKKNFFEVELPVWDSKAEFAGLDDAVAEVHAKIGRAVADGVAPSRILLGGHGPGAALALFAGRTYSDQLAGIACLGGWLMRPDVASSAARPPILLCHGDDDDEVPYEHYMSSLHWLRSAHYECTYHEYEGFGHQQVADELTVLAAPKNFITERLPPIVTHSMRAAHAAAAKARAAAKQEKQQQQVPRMGLDKDKESKAAEAAPASEASDALDKEAWRAAEALVESAAEAERAGPAAARPADATARAAAAQCALLSLEEDAAGEALHVSVRLGGVRSMAEVELSVGATRVELRGVAAGAGAPPLLAFDLPKPVDPDASGAAKFSAKSATLRVVLAIDHVAHHWANFLYRHTARPWKSLWCRYAPSGSLTQHFTAERIFTPLAAPRQDGCEMRVIYHYPDERGTVRDGPACGPWTITAAHSLADGLTHPAQPTSMTTLMLPGGPSGWCMKRSPAGAPCATELFLHHGEHLRMSAGVIHAAEDGQLKQLSLIREDVRAHSAEWQDDAGAWATGLEATPIAPSRLVEVLARAAAPTAAAGRGHAITASLRQRPLTGESWSASRVAAADAAEDVLLLCGDENVVIVAPAQKREGAPFSSACAWWPVAQGDASARVIYTIEARWDAAGALTEVRYVEFNGSAGCA